MTNFPALLRSSDQAILAEQRDHTVPLTGTHSREAFMAENPNAVRLPIARRDRKAPRAA